jgi:prenyltransferase beta subunit
MTFASKFLQFFCTAVMVFTLVGGLKASAEEPKRELLTAEIYQESVQKALKWERKKLASDSLCDGFLAHDLAGTSEGDWFVLAERVLDIDDNYDDYARVSVEKFADFMLGPDGGYLTEPARIAVAAVLCDEDQRENFAELVDLDISQAGANELAWLAAAQNFCSLDNAKTVKKLCKMQQSDGGFGLSNSDADITAMALMALPKDGENAEKALDYLKKYFAETDEISCETAAQMIIGLCAQGVNCSESSDFTKENGVRLTEILLSYQTDDGGFSHVYGDESNTIATMEALAALAVQGYFSVAGEYYLNENFALTDVLSTENPFAEGFFKYDSDQIESIDEPLASDFSMISELKNRADEYGIDDETLDILKEKYAISKRKCDEIEKLNAKIRENFYPASDVNFTKLSKISALNKEISSYKSADKELILSANELSEREKALKKEAAAGAILIIILACSGVIYIIKRTKSHEQLRKKDI